MNTRTTFKCCGLVLSLMGISSLCFILWVNWSYIKDEYIVFQRKQDLSSVEKEFNAIFDDLPRSKTDTVLTIRTHPLTIGRGLFAGCIEGSKEIVYGTTRDFKNVIDEYETLFENKQPWTQNNETNYRIEKARFWLYLHEPSSSAYPECEGYPVCYSASLFYADPSYERCSG